MRPVRLATLVLFFSAVGCGLPTGPGGGGTGGTGAFTGSVSGASGANNTSTSMNALAFGGACSAQNGGTLCTITATELSPACITLIMYLGGKVAAGKSYALDQTNIAVATQGEGDGHGFLDYGEIHGAPNCQGGSSANTYVWVATGGSVVIDSVAGQAVKLHFDNVPMGIVGGSSSGPATGTFNLSGSGTTQSFSGD